jgi:hypothetical protein
MFAMELSASPTGQSGGGRSKDAPWGIAVVATVVLVELVVPSWNRSQDPGKMHRQNRVRHSGRLTIGAQAHAVVDTAVRILAEMGLRHQRLGVLWESAGDSLWIATGRSVGGWSGSHEGHGEKGQKLGEVHLRY